jgi:hypothetical protein
VHSTRPSSGSLAASQRGNSWRGQLIGTDEIYLSLIGVGRAVDVVVVTPEDVDRYRDARALVIAPALREGRVVYAA